ncbi:amino acid adenylation domain-containing protein, partial [Clostridium gasigenes]
MNLIDLILEKKWKNDAGIVFVKRGKDDKKVSYKELYNKSMKILGGLQKYGINKGDELIFQFSDNEDCINVFWACLMGGIIPVPITKGENFNNLMKIFKVSEKLNNPYLIGERKQLDYIKDFACENKITVQKIENKFIDISEVNKEENNGQLAEINGDDIAFIQFSSGSTGDPKGVILTHTNLITNLDAITTNSNMSEDDILLSWVPLTHDMGLIGCHLAPLSINMNQVNINTIDFIKRPTLWIEKASEYKATLLESPNFGYRYLLMGMKRRSVEKCDLSSVRLIFNGAEPISRDLCDEFLDSMSKYNLRRSSMYPVYGLAEACLAVTFPYYYEENFIVHKIDRRKMNIKDEIIYIQNESDEYAAEFVDVGYPVKHVEIKIKDLEGNDLNENVIGLIYIRGKNVTSGYYNDEEISKKLIDKDGWLNSGDLGFIHNKRLVIVGRYKDVLFLNGQNFYANDLEKIIQRIEGIDLGEAQIAIGATKNYSNNEEEVIVFIEYRKKFEDFIQIESQIKTEINCKSGVKVDYVIPIKKIPKTTSGKVQRFELIKKYENGEFGLILDDFNEIKRKMYNNTEEAKNQLETELLELLKSESGIETLNVNDNFFEIGLNSLIINKISSQIKKYFGQTIKTKEIYQYPSIREMAQFLTINNFSNGDEIDETFYYDDIDRNKNIQDKYIATSTEKRMYTIQKLNPNNLNYNLPYILKINRKIDVDKIKEAINKLINRHYSLRSYFEEEGEVLYQKIKDIEYMEIEIIENKSNRNVKEFLEEQKMNFVKPFYLNSLPLIRVEILKLEEDKHTILFDFNHIIFDGASSKIFFNEFLELINGRELESLDLEYKKYFLYKNYVNDKSIKRMSKYWEEEFKVEPEILNIPTDFPRPAKQTFVGDIISININKKNNIEKICIENKITPYMFFLSVINILINKLTNQSDIVIGTIVEGREKGLNNNLVGMFANTIPIRCEVNTLDSLGNLFYCVRENCINAFENSDLEFEEIINILKFKRDLSRNPLFDVILVYQNNGIDISEEKDINMEINKIMTNSSKVDLLFEVIPNKYNYEIEIEYNSDLFNRDTINRFGEYITTLIDNIIKNKNDKICNLSILREKEKVNILLEENKNYSNYDNNITIQELFERQVENSPNNIAVVYEENRITYEELNKKSNVLARKLRECGVIEDTIIGLVVERSIDMIISIMAILKAGGAYLPIDSKIPKERIDYIIKDSGLKLLLVTDNTNILIENNITKLNISDQNIFIGNGSNLNIINKSSSLAYIIYTSGTTGKPKGAMIEHKNLVRLLFNDKFQFDFNSNDVWTMFHSYCFDFSVWEMYGAILYGGKLIIIPELLTKDFDGFFNLLKKEKVTILNQTPSAFYNIIDIESNNESKELNLRYVIFGGEALNIKKLRNWKNRYVDTKLINMYGITETTVHVTYKEITMEIIEEGISNIGKAIPTLKTYIMDEYKNLVPVGIPGELYVAGEGLARGYLNREELTREKFIENPHVKGERIYKSGDLVKRLPNGDLEYLGRIDNQVKIRGFRIELGEIESKLLKYRNVKEAVVIARED